MYDYDSNNNEKQVKETVPTRSQNWLFSKKIPHRQSPLHNSVGEKDNDHSALSDGSFS